LPSALPPNRATLANPHSLIPSPCLYACLYSPPVVDRPAASASTLVAVAQEFSPRYERHRDDLVSIDVSGLTRLLGPARTIGEEMRREAAARGVRVHVAIAGTRMAAMLLAIARPGLTIVAPGDEAAALASLPLGLLEKVDQYEGRSPKCESEAEAARTSDFVLRTSKKWGLKTLGELAALPSADLVSRFGRPARVWQALARGEDLRPLVPMLEEERFEASLDLEWPIADLEPLSFVLTRLLEPLSTRLERRDRGAAVLHIVLHLVTRETTARRLELPTPMRDVRALRTLALLDLEARPAEAAIDRVTIVIDPTPGRVVQHTLYTRAQPTPEQLSTLLARLGALMGGDRYGKAALLDTDRPGAFAMTAFAVDQDKTEERTARSARADNRPQTCARSAAVACPGEPSALSPEPAMASALRRCRQPVPARVAVIDGRPVRVTTDRRGFAGGTVTHCAGPWRTSGEWWADGKFDAKSPKLEVQVQSSEFKLPSSGAAGAGWNRDEWDVALSDGAVYRVFHDRAADRWFIDAIVD
jgi:protein ImuB